MSGCCFSVTLADGTRYLIHKGGNYGDASNTVVTHARHMSSSWRVSLRL